MRSLLRMAAAAAVAGMAQTGMAIAQQRLTSSVPILFHAQTANLQLSVPSSESVQYVRSIMAKIGLPMRFEVHAANVANAAASIRDGKRLILFNPVWVSGLVAQSRTNWAMAQVLAHEVGHHLSFHEGGYSSDVSANHRQELESDYFSGFILARMGATLEEAIAADRALAMPDSPTHPGSERRVREVARGWRDARGEGTGSASAGSAGAQAPAPASPTPLPKSTAPLQASAGSGRSFWNHNGSTMLLLSSGNTRKFYYEEPREGMRLAGAEKGTLLFAGERVRSGYRGVSHIFRGKCGKYYYEVEGRVEDGDRRIVLEGRAPKVNESCQVVGSVPDTLVFTYLRIQ